MRSDLPKDPYILLSVVNTALRDEFNSLDDMCKSMNFDRDKIVTTLNEVGYVYDDSLNTFTK